MSKLPWWVQAIAIVGFPALISMHLLGMLPGLPSPIAALQKSLDSHATETSEQTRVLRVICYKMTEGTSWQELCRPQ